MTTKILLVINRNPDYSGEFAAAEALSRANLLVQDGSWRVIPHLSTMVGDIEVEVDVDIGEFNRNLATLGNQKYSQAIQTSLKGPDQRLFKIGHSQRAVASIVDTLRKFRYRGIQIVAVLGLDRNPRSDLESMSIPVKLCYWDGELLHHRTISDDWVLKSGISDMEYMPTDMHLGDALRMIKTDPPCYPISKLRQIW